MVRVSLVGLVIVVAGGSCRRPTPPDATVVTIEPPAAPSPMAAFGARVPAAVYKDVSDWRSTLVLSSAEIEGHQGYELSHAAFVKPVWFLDAGFASAYRNKATVNRTELAGLMPRHWRAVYVAHKLAEQKLDGGLFTFFWNSNGELNEFLVEDLTEIGAVGQAGVMQDALRLFDARGRADVRRPAGGTADLLGQVESGTRDGAYKEVEARLDTDGIFESVARYVKARPGLFTTPPPRE